MPICKLLPFAPRAAVEATEPIVELSEGVGVERGLRGDRGP